MLSSEYFGSMVEIPWKCFGNTSDLSNQCNIHILQRVLFFALLLNVVFQEVRILVSHASDFVGIESFGGGGWG